MSRVETRVPSNRRSIRWVALVAGGVLVLAACGSGDSPGDGGGGGDSDRRAEVDLDEVRSALDAIEFESDAVEGGSVLGNTPLDDAAAARVESAEAAAAEFEAELESFEPCPEEGPCDDEPPLGPAPTVPPPFVPSAAWAPFCTVLAEIEQRPFPTEPSEAARVVDVWFGLLAPYVPAEIGADFGVLDRLIDDAVTADDISVIENAPDEVEAAAERIGEAVDVGCSGR